MAKLNLTKRALIDKNNKTIVIVTGVAAFVFIFSLVATKAFVSQASYQNRVISAKRSALDKLKKDVQVGKSLKASYDAFTSTAQNVIGGDPNGNGPQDGNNAKIILDALPSSYDFPALTTSVEKLITNANVTINGISGTDDEVNQSSNTSSSSPQPVPMPFQVTVNGNYQGIQTLIDEFQYSIRPFQIQTMEISASGDANNTLDLDLTAQTFYQPAKSLKISSKVVN